jgi:hypothetical protein
MSISEVLLRWVVPLAFVITLLALAISFAVRDDRPTSEPPRHDPKLDPPMLDDHRHIWRMNDLGTSGRCIYCGKHNYP